MTDVPARSPRPSSGRGSGHRHRGIGGRREHAQSREVEELGPVLSGLLPEGWDGAIAAKDQAALDAAVRRAWSVVYHRARARVADPTEAEEVAQEVFCRVLLRISQGTDEEDLEVRTGYLVQAARNLLADRWRARTRHQDADARYAESRSTAPELPDELLVRSEEHADVRRAMSRLSPSQRQVLRLRVLEGLSAEETAAVVGKSAEAVRQEQHRALTVLRRTLGGGNR